MASLLSQVVMERIGLVLAELQADALGPAPSEMQSTWSALAQSTALSGHVLVLFGDFLAAPDEYRACERHGALFIERLGRCAAPVGCDAGGTALASSRSPSMQQMKENIS